MTFMKDFEFGTNWVTYDSIKQLTTLNTGSILIIFAFIGNFEYVGNKGFLNFSLICFFCSLLFSTVILLILSYCDLEEQNFTFWLFGSLFFMSYLLFIVGLFIVMISIL